MDNNKASRAARREHEGHLQRHRPWLGQPVRCREGRTHPGDPYRPRRHPRLLRGAGLRPAPHPLHARPGRGDRWPGAARSRRGSERGWQLLRRPGERQLAPHRPGRRAAHRCWSRQRRAGRLILGTSVGQLREEALLGNRGRLLRQDIHARAGPPARGDRVEGRSSQSRRFTKEGGVRRVLIEVGHQAEAGRIRRYEFAAFKDSIAKGEAPTVSTWRSL